MSVKHFLGACGAALALAGGAAHASLVIAPGSAAGSDGNSNNCFPFSCGTMHYQQEYDASLFGGKAGIISALMFRTDSASSSFVNRALDMTITFSNARTSAATMSTTFASNVGSNATTVFDGSGLFSAAARSGTAFNFLIDVADTFYYDGSSNLLMDIVVRNGSIGTSLDSVDSSGVGFNRVWGSVGSASGSMGGDKGLVTAFNLSTVAVPEPGSFALLGAAIGLLAYSRRRARK